jgi:hypothetical protein
MLRNDENRTLGNWILVRKFFLKKKKKEREILPLFLRGDCSQSQDASIKPLCMVCLQKTKAFMAVRNFLRTQ